MATVFEASYTELKKAEAEIERLRAALKPFADMAGNLPGSGYAHIMPGAGPLTFDDFRRAAIAFGEQSDT